MGFFTLNGEATSLKEHPELLLGLLGGQLIKGDKEKDKAADPRAAEPIATPPDQPPPTTAPITSMPSSPAGVSPTLMNPVTQEMLGGLDPVNNAKTNTPSFESELVKLLASLNDR